jgi:hypothetical protein
VDPIPAKTIERYRKLKALAGDSSAAEQEKRTAGVKMREIEIAHPAIVKVVAQLEHHEQAIAASKGQTWSPPRPSRQEIEDLIPGVIRLVSERLGLKLVDRIDSVLDWSLDQINQAQRESFAREFAQGSAVNPGGLMLLHEQITEDVDVSVEDVEDEETGEELILFEITIPPALWHRIQTDPAGPALLVSYMQQVAGLPPEADEG